MVAKNSLASSASNRQDRLGNSVNLNKTLFLDTSYLNWLRHFELECALQSFPDLSTRDCSVLEIGAGTGYQARELADRGFSVIAVDVASSAYRDQRVYPILDYDGRILPVATKSMRVVFSSNALEHVKEIDPILDEINRVLVPGGFAIHILPTPAWRFWTIISHYGWLIKQLFAYLMKIGSRKTSDSNFPHTPKSWQDIVGTLFPLRHGERGFTISEIYYYSSRWWIRKFESHGFQLIANYPTGIFYTGSQVFGEKLTISHRKTLSRWLGSACRIYVMKH